MIHYADDSTINAILAVPHWTETRAIFGPVDGSTITPEQLDARAYGEDHILSCATEGRLFSTDTPSLGGACAETIQLQVIQDLDVDDTPAPGNVVHVGWRLHSDDGTMVSAWHYSKQFDISDIKRKVYKYPTGPSYYTAGEVWTIRGTDALARADVPILRLFDPKGSASYRNLGSLVVAVAGLIGLGVDTATDTILSAITLDSAAFDSYPDEDTTIRQLLGWCAALAGGSFIVTKANGSDGTDWNPGALHLQQFVTGSTVQTIADARQWCGDFQLGNMSNGSAQWDILFTGGVGDQDARAGAVEPTFRLETACPFATASDASRVAALVCGTSDPEHWFYTGWEARDVLADPRLELGDWLGGDVLTGQVLIATMRRQYSHAFTAELSAPDPARFEMDTYAHEYVNAQQQSSGTRRATRAAGSWDGRLSRNVNGLPKRKATGGGSTATKPMTLCITQKIDFAKTGGAYPTLAAGVLKNVYNPGDDIFELSAYDVAEEVELELAAAGKRGSTTKDDWVFVSHQIERCNDDFPLTVNPSFGYYVLTGGETASLASITIRNPKSSTLTLNGWFWYTQYWHYYGDDAAVKAWIASRGTYYYHTEHGATHLGDYIH